MLRQHYAQAELHVMVAEHVTVLLEATPWIDCVWGYPRFPKGPKWYQDFARIGRLRAAAFDVIINLNGSDRSSLLSFFSAARWRLGRIPEDGGPLFWKSLFTHTVHHPYGETLVFIQRWKCLLKAGFLSEKPEFPLSLPDSVVTHVRELIGLSDTTQYANHQRRWIHLSPFTTQDEKELPQAVLSTTLNSLFKQFPNLPIILSCAKNERECSRMASLLARLTFTPQRVFAGSLTLLEFVALIQGSILHLGGDSGALHVAAMTCTQSVCWFRNYKGNRDWMPSETENIILRGTASAEGICDISPDVITQSVIKAISALLNPGI